MRNRALVCALLIGASTALTAAPTGAPQDIDVDAMARAKDVDAKAAEAPPEPATLPEPAEAAAEPVVANESTAAAPVADAKPAEPPADAAPAGTATDTPSEREPTPAEEAMSEEKRIAASCVARASSLLDAAQKGDYAAATQDFDARMSSALPPAKFGEAWAQLSQFGKLKARGQSHAIKGEGYLAVTIPLIFEKKNLYAQVACGDDGRIAGFHVKPLDIPVQ